MSIAPMFPSNGDGSYEKRDGMELPSVPGVGQRTRAGVRLMANENPAELSKSALRDRNCENSCGDPGPTGVECMQQTTQQPTYSIIIILIFTLSTYYVKNQLV